MDYQWHDLVGNAGVATIVGTYLLLQLDRLEGTSLAYGVLNAVGASLVLVSLAFDFNLSAFAIEAFWVLISGVGIVRTLRGRRAGPARREGAQETWSGRRRTGDTSEHL